MNAAELTTAAEAMKVYKDNQPHSENHFSFPSNQHMQNANHVSCIAISANGYLLFFLFCELQEIFSMRERNIRMQLRQIWKLWKAINSIDLAIYANAKQKHVLWDNLGCV